MEYRTQQDAFNDPGLFSTCAAALMMDNFDAGWVDWEPETVEMELHGLRVDVTTGLMDKLMAVSVLMSTNLFHVSFETWNNLVQIFNFSRISSEMLVPASIEDILWGCSEARILEGPDTYDAEGFSHDIAVYTGTLLTQHGMTKPPSILNFAEINESEIDNRDIMLASDEFTFKSYWDSHKTLLEDSEKDAIDKTKELLVQLRQLPIKNGDLSFLENVELPAE